MEPIFIPHRRYSSTRLIPTVAMSLGLSLLVGCSSLPTDNPAQQNSTSDANPAESVSEFSFPQTNCGDQAAQPSGTWYVVYLDGANPDEVRREYCRDAIGTVRDGSGVPTVQVASFIDYNKALRFAAAVGGEVEATTYNQSPSPGAQSPTATGSPGASSPSSTTSLVGRTAYLSAKDAGSTINVRANPSLSAPIQLTGKIGEPVRVSDRMQGEDGNTWYKVAFEAGQEGWVRSDFISDSLASSATTNSTAATGYSSYNPNAYGASSSPAASGSGSSSYASPSSGYASPSSATSSGYGSNGASAYNSSDSRQDSSSDATASSSASPDTTSTDAEEPPTAGESVVLTASDPGSRINVRSDASTSAQISHAGYPGDSGEVTEIAQGEDGYTWYNVRFSSGETGWVRGDFIEGP